MKWLALAGLAALGLVVGGAIWARMVEVPADRYHRAEGPDTPGDHPAEGGFATVREVPDPEAALAALTDAAQSTPRTRRLAGSVDEGHVSYVTRSRVFGFPDVTNAWISDGRLHVRAHLIVGKGDMGVNRARVEDWLARAGIA